MTKKVVVLGGSGMLGSMVTGFLARDTNLDVVATVRTQHLLNICQSQLPNVTWRLFDSLDERTWRPLEGADWVINAIGITKPLIHDDNAAEVERAVRVNALFPQLLAQRTQHGGTQILQIATDCVYSGSKGAYVEGDMHDALDVYGKTKSLGEVCYPHVHHLRCSIIGPEPKDRRFLVEWFLSQPRDKEVNGFVNHFWNGVTTLQFAQVCHGIITHDVDLPHLHHVVPAAAMSKADMLVEFAAAYARKDIIIRRVEAASVIDRTLQTGNEALNRELWRVAGYKQAPSVGYMIREMAGYERRLVALDEQSEKVA